MLLHINYITEWCFNLMGPPLYMRSVVDRNVVMRCVNVYEGVEQFILNHMENGQ